MRETFCWKTLGECGLSVSITCQALVSFTTITFSQSLVPYAVPGTCKVITTILSE